MLKLISLGAIIIVLILIISIFGGFITIPGMDILGSEGYETQKKWYNNYHGNHYSELLLPADRKGFITSFRSDIEFGLSETITVAGNYKAQIGFSQIHKLRYIIKWKATPTSGWEIVSEPGKTEKWISVKNPGVFNAVSAGSDRRDCRPYVFNIRGQRDGAIRAELWGFFDPNELNPWDGYEWKRLSSDQAKLSSGICGMWLPDRDDGGYRSTFEIGETVKIKVETGVGAVDIEADGREGTKTWELHLKKPNGNEYTDQNFPRKLSDHFRGDVTFEIYEDMFTLGGNNRYSLELYNTLWKQGTLQLSSIDVLSKRPDEPLITPDCGLSLIVPASVIVEVKANPNPETQVNIEYFGVMVFYGKHVDLAPGSWGADRWILRDTKITASGNKATFDFEVTQPNRWFTIIVYSHDEEGRDSDTDYYQVKTYESEDDEESDDDLVNEGGGQGSYGGGTSGETTPWDFWEGDKPLEINWWGVLAVFLIIVCFALIGLYVFKSPKMMILMIIVGSIIGVLVYVVFFTNMVL